jgi:hypothetical protein
MDKRLPNAENAIVADRKITHYLLSSDHPKGRAKAAFFSRFGFTLDDPVVLAKALLEHASANSVVAVHTSHSGVKYEISGPLAAPDGRLPIVKSVWIVDAGNPIPRFVTAVPD